MAVKEPGLLLVHGWSGRPEHMRWLAEKFQKKGYVCSVVRLAGHDSSLEAFEASGWKDWERSVQDAWDSLARRTGRMGYLGLSAGGTLGLLQASRKPREPDALLTINAPVLRLKPSMALSGWLRHIKHFIKGGPRNIENAQARAAHPGWPRLPLRAIWQLDSLLSQSRWCLPRVTCPLLVVRSRVDGTVPASSAQWIIQETQSWVKQSLVLERGWHVAAVDDGKEELFKNALSFFNKQLRS